MNDPLGNKHLNDGGESPSAYASAESSPSHSMATSLSMHSMQAGAATSGNEDEFVMVNSRSSGMTVSQSMSSFSPRSPSSPTQHINLSSIPSSMSVSGIDTLAKLEELNMQGFTSLPPVKSSPDNVQKIIENTIKSEVEKQTSPKQTSPTSQRSSVFSVFGRFFSKSASKPAEDKDKSKTNESPTTSSTSPKLDSPKSCSRAIIFEEDEKSAVNPEVKEAASLLNNATSVEKLVQQSNDQVLSPASTAKVDDTEAKPASSTETMKVPASSQEFCNDLNLCIAASAALAVAAPVAISDNSSKSGKTHLQCPSSSNDHQRFTKNASTSSIHNDLKAILEESKESSSSLHASISDGKKAETGVTSPASIKTSPKKRRSNKSVTSDESFKKPSSSDQPAKPQREKKTRNKHSKSSDKKTTTSPEQQKQPVDSKINVFEMLMKTAVTAVAESKTTTNTKRTPYQYSRDFLLRIRDERAKLIDNICPEIFRTHAYCISGAYWDPERYFNAMLHGERLYDFVNNNQSSVSNYGPKAGGQQTNRSQNNHHGRKWVKKNQTENDRSKTSSTNVLNSLMGAQKSSSWSHQSQTPLSNQPLADKYLLDLLKNNSSGSPRNADLMTILNKKNNDYDERLVKPRHSPLILTAQELEFSQMFSPAKPTGRTPERHHPTNSGSSPGSVRSSNLSPSSMSSGQMASNSEDTEGDNSSDAYKQLVRNLNNHPLSSVPAGRVNAVDEFFNRSSLKTNEGPKQEGSNLIKQLLNLNLSTGSNEEANNSFNKHTRPHHHHHHHNNQNYRHHGKPKSSKPMMPRKSPTSGNLESLMLKLKASESGSHEQEHFNKLLEKLVPTLGSHLTSTNGSNNKDDILKWFRSSSSTQNNRY